MTSRVAKILREIDLPEYIDAFEDKNIDYKTMLALKKFPDMISQIIPNIRDQIKFRLSLDSICEVNEDIAEKPVENAAEPLLVWEEDCRQVPPKEGSRKRSQYVIRETLENNVQVEENDDDTEFVWKRICIDAGIGNAVDSEDAENESSTNHADQQELSKGKKSCHLIREVHGNEEQTKGNDNLAEFEWNQICIESTVGNAVVPQDADEGVQIVKEQQKNYIYKILEVTTMGKSILGYYKKGLFDNLCRAELAKQILYAEYGTNLNTIINTPRFVELSNFIVECFPGELAETYYIPSYVRGKRRPASGKLYDMYNNFNKFLRAGGLRDCIHRPNNRSPQKSSLPPVTNSEHLQQKLDFLSTYLKPWDEIKRCWEGTVSLRMQKLRDSNNGDFKLSDYVRKFPVLSEPGSHILLEYDFGILFPQAAEKWQLKWPSISQRLKYELMLQGLHKKYLDCDASILYHYPFLFSVTTVRVPNQKPWRACKSEIQNGFLVHLKVIGDYEKTLEGMRQTARSRGTELQPVPFIVGESLENITDSFVSLDGKLLPVESPARAVEVTFKMYHALNCKYPVQSARLWTVLGSAVFDIQENVEAGVSPDMIRLIKILS